MIVDLHCDTLMECYLGGKSLLNGNMQLNLEKLQKGGVMAQCFAVYIPTNELAVECKVTQEPFDYYRSCVEVYHRELAKNSSTLQEARTAADVLKNWKDGKISSILTIEDGVLLGNRLERLDELYDDGVRMIALTHDYENCIGFPHSDDPEKMAKGLKPFGIEVVRRMNELGMIVDVSHLSEGGFYDVAKYTSKPFVASHSCARALCSRSRNLWDDMLRALGDKGGVCGVNFCPGFLKDQSTFSKIEYVVQHMQHIRNVAGIDAIAFGSDYDGNEGVKEWGDADGLPRIVDAMQKAFTDDEIDKICWKNALRVLKDATGD